jgi:beta-N-acetylhexosaminidase
MKLSKLFGILLVLISISFNSCLIAKDVRKGNKEENYSKEDLELRRKIAQMLILGFRGTELKSSDNIYKLITREGIGGVILFDYDVPSKKAKRNIENPNQLRKLCRDLQKAGTNKLLISIDQEGGKVSRLKEIYGFPPTVSQQYLGDNHNKKLTSEWAARTATNLKSLGINLNFAPSVDVNINPQCPIIGKLERSFSSDEERVITHSKLVIEEHRKKGILTAIKHFPGHGSSNSDTHKGVVDVTDTYQERELIPFQRLIDEGYVDMIMTSHVFNANIDSVYPSTLSYKTLTNLLRVKMGYRGIIISDDMAMGVNIFIFSNNGETYDDEIGYKFIDTVFQLVKEGKVSEQSIINSYVMIEKLKAKMELR